MLSQELFMTGLYNYLAFSTVERNKPPLIFTIATLILLTSSMTQADSAVEPLKQRYQQLGAATFSAERGQILWNRKATHKASEKKRSCADCHTDNLKRAGRHIRTGKAITPLFPGADPRRLTRIKKVEKWFKRNCKWTWDRPCTPQEKGDLLSFIQSGE